MENYQQIFEDQTPESRKLYQRSSRVIPGGVCHNLRYNPPYPIFVARAKGPYVWDADGNRYLDFWMGHYANILGHSPDFVVQRLQELLAQGNLHHGQVNPLEVELAELACELIPSAEKIRFCCTGTEATMYAVRLARAYTGRRHIIKIQGGWHGANDSLLTDTFAPFDQPDSLGLIPEMTKHVSALTFNDTEAARQMIRRLGNDLAAVIMEPVVGSGGFIPADMEFLTTVRQETEAAGALLIFDEIISGFRVALGGAQQLFGVLPDMTLLGKVLGGGMPAGAIAGRADIMDFCNLRLRPHKYERAMAGGGTFSCLPMSMAAGICTLNYLKQHAAEVYPKLAAMGNSLRTRIEQAFASHNITAKCTGIGSLFMTHFPLQPGTEIRSPYDAYCRADLQRREVELKVRLLAKGVYVMHGGGAISLAHTPEDLEFFVQQMEAVAREIKL